MLKLPRRALIDPIRRWTRGQLVAFCLGLVPLEIWALRALHRIETAYPRLTGINDLSADDPYRDIPLRTDLRVQHGWLEAAAFFLIPGIAALICWLWFGRGPSVVHRDVSAG